MVDADFFDCPDFLWCFMLALLEFTWCFDERRNDWPVRSADRLDLPINCLLTVPPAVRAFPSFVMARCFSEPPCLVTCL